MPPKNFRLQPFLWYITTRCLLYSHVMPPSRSRVSTSRRFADSSERQIVLPPWHCPALGKITRSLIGRVWCSCLEWNASISTCLGDTWEWQLITNPKHTPHIASPRVQRWAVTLSAYGYKLTYHSGSKQGPQTVWSGSQYQPTQLYTKSKLTFVNDSPVTSNDIRRINHSRP